MNGRLVEYPCPKCGDVGPHPVADPEAPTVECAHCFAKFQVPVEAEDVEEAP